MRLRRLTTGRLIGIDKDQEALDYSAERLKEFKNITLVKSDFKNAKNVLEDLGISGLDGVLIDLGISSHQIDSAERGFSFLRDGKLDMRMDKSQALSAYDVVNSYSEQELLRILWDYGEEPFARKIVSAKSAPSRPHLNLIKSSRMPCQKRLCLKVAELQKRHSKQSGSRLMAS